MNWETRAPRYEMTGSIPYRSGIPKVGEVNKVMPLQERTQLTLTAPMMLGGSLEHLEHAMDGTSCKTHQPCLDLPPAALSLSMENAIGTQPKSLADVAPEPSVAMPTQQKLPD